MSERPTFSPFWHRVRAMTPRLRPHVQITRQHYRGQRWHVLQDPSTNQFFRLGPVAYEYVQMLDGRRTVEEVWKISLSRHGDDAPTQGEVIQLISQLYNSNLLTVDATPDVEQLLGRGRERLRKSVQQQAIGLMYFKIKVFNPDRILAWIEPILRPILNRWGLIAWAGLLVFAIVSIAPYWEELRLGIESTLAPSNWGWIAVVFVVTKLIHEIGHGVICKRFGGQVPEFGFMLLVMMPAPFVDASASWAFASKWRRIAVGAGGMIFELAIASVAALVWISTLSGGSPLVHQIAYNAMFTASLSTILFNANPLMRFDGYYMLSDLLEIPNLMQRSTTMLKHLWERLVFRVRDTFPPSSARDEQVILVVYGIAALVYRIFLFFSITLYVMGKMFGLGLVLAVWTASVWFILPMAGFVHYLASSPKIADRRGQVVFTTLAIAAAVSLLIGAVPFPDRRYGEGVIESPGRTGIFAGVDGFITDSHVRPGDVVREGDPLITMTSRELQAQRETVEAMIRETESLEREYLTQSHAMAQIAREKVATLREQRRFIDDRGLRLVVRAPRDGVIVGRDPTAAVGMFVREGTFLCELVDTSALRVAGELAQTEGSWLFELPRESFKVEMRTHSRIDRIVEGSVERIIEAGQRELPHPALGVGGGGVIETDPQDRSGRQIKRPRFRVDIHAPGVPIGAPGERVRIRYTLPDKPLVAQWVDRLQKIVQGRVNI
ncbi:MAG: PqqD family peptide modification chaperone [Phycisphaeraceae bacterium]|nr:PqqD family peptide modification chaperone [Phycisphaerae bacterium]MBX3392126.1 PqqD family peptide modification chaperone [Phycisphaeraceae bacterium]